MDDFDAQTPSEEYLKMAAQAARANARYVDADPGSGATAATAASIDDPTAEFVGDPDDVEMPHSTKPRGAGSHRKPVKLDDEDPFLLIEGLNADGGVDGVTEPMNTAQMACFRAYCNIPATMRSIARLRKLLEQEQGHAPSASSLNSWAVKFNWSALAGEFDKNLQRYRFKLLEDQRREADARHARVGRQMQELMSLQMARIVREYNEPPQPLRDPQTGKVLINPRTGKPIFPPKKTLAGIQGCAVAYKIGVETERVALGIPTVLTTDRFAEQQGREQTMNVNVTLTLEEWRRHSSDEGRFSSGRQPGMVRAINATADGQTHVVEGALALPAPAPEAARDHEQREREGLVITAQELDALPEDWFVDAPPAVVDAPHEEGDSDDE